MTAAEAERQIVEKEAFQEELREEIDRMPEGTSERQRKVDLLFTLHAEIFRLLDQITA